MKLRPINNIELGALIALSLVLFIPFGLFAPRQLAFEILDAIAISLAVGGASSYAVETWHALKMPIHKMLAAHYIVAGVFFALIGMGVLFTGLLFWRINGKPEWFIDGALVLFSRWIAVIGLALFMITSYSRGGVVTVGAFSRPTMATLIAFIAVISAWWLVVSR